MRPSHRMAKFSWMAGFAGLLIVIIGGPAWTDESAKQDGTEVSFQRLALAPFLVGRRHPRMDASMDNTLSCPINEICVDDPTIAPQAGEMMTRLVQAKLRSRFGQNVVSLDEVYAAHTGIRLDSDTDTPRTLARKMGRATSADLVIVGTVWRYRQPGAIEGLPDMPASVAFAVYLVDVETGRRLWRGFYDGTQDIATNNLFNVSKRLKMGTRWLSADALARHGVDEALNPLSGRIHPDR